MKRLLTAFLAAFFLISCSTVPLTGRKQLDLIPSSQIISMSFSQYQQVLQSEEVVTGTDESRMVKSVGRDIATAVEKFLNENGYEEEASMFEWEFNLLRNDQVNAWCMPGGKVAFYTGIMPICENDQGVAVVMGHEVAHAVAEHGGERMSQGLVQQLGGVALAVALSEKPQQTQQLFMTAYGLGSTVGYVLPHSRQQESEADKLGLIFMAMAGYDPRVAPQFWERMAAESGGGSPPEFLSTHPSHSTRINNLNKYMDQAMKYYRGN
ncbi:M48 family metallopeptidase [Roseivirga sp. BDSF3-8]|uniref:M48 family metallopeptidase n=1 Tax=Roseivirga sp. BDSF3-8 TaxID=3241598 RepID=UPI003531888F